MELVTQEVIYRFDYPSKVVKVCLHRKNVCDSFTNAVVCSVNVLANCSLTVSNFKRM